jgi:hypothetical protein
MGFRVPAVQIVPLPDDQVSFQVQGQEKLRWHFSPRYAKPFFYPLIGPSGRSLTRMGHPDAPDHDHHKSLWWAHQFVGGVNFWEERGGSQQIRQETWVHFQDGPDWAGLVTRLGWIDAHKVRLMQQEMMAIYRPLEKQEAWLELQTTFFSSLEKLPLARTNFGFIGLRVSAGICARFGGGRLTSSEGNRGEKALFAQPARWMDYSGPNVGETWEGITWFDHPRNPRHPASWHVRDDGWMSPAFCLREGWDLHKNQPLRLRYGFHLHGGDVTPKIAEAHFKTFGDSSPWQLGKGNPPWRIRLVQGK